MKTTENQKTVTALFREFLLTSYCNYVNAYVYINN